MRKFEKISYVQFSKDCMEDKDLYQEYIVPVRSTKTSAGYDFSLLMDVTLNPEEQTLIPTGIKAKMEEDEVLFLMIRSSLAIQKYLQLSNQIGVIDSDYYNNSKNEGHIFVALKNVGKERITLKRGEHFVQGIFLKFLQTDDDIPSNILRDGGFGSTNRGE